MNRRRFLAVSVTPFVGCGRKESANPSAAFDAAAFERRQTFLVDRQTYRIAPTSVFTTPKPPANVSDLVPELKGLSKIVVRLHPRDSAPPRVHESKLGGPILWPADEPWPIHDKTKLPYQPVLQLSADDAPPNFAYRPGTDLLQLLWCPHRELFPIIAWRKSSAVGGDLAAVPEVKAGTVDVIPAECRLFPERVMEYPGIDVLPESVRGKIKDTAEYDRMLSVACGTKVGGYPKGLKPGDDTSCPSCHKVTDFLLTIDQSEWTVESKSRWMPVEEQGKPALPNHAGMQLGMTFGRVHLFICRRCEGWPIRHVIQAD